MSDEHEAIGRPDRLKALRATGLLDSGPAESFDRLGSLASRLLRAPIALVSLVDEDRQFFKSCIGLPEPFASSRETPLSHSICQHTLTQPEPLVIHDAARDPRVAQNGAVTDLGVASYLGIPLVTEEGHTLGSFCVIDHVPRDWTDEDISVLSDLAASVMAEIALHERSLERHHVAEALERIARREQEERRRTGDLLELVQGLSRSASIDQMAQVVATHAAAAVGADFCNIAVATADGAHLDLHHGLGLGDSIVDRWARIPLDDSTPLGAAVCRGRAVLVGDPGAIRRDFPAGAADAAAAGFESLAALPLGSVGAAVGFAWRTARGDAIDHPQLATVAELCAQAMTRAEEFERQRRVARVLQQQLLPQELPEASNADLAIRYAAGAEGLDIGGDWYDVQVDTSRLVVSVGDVVGRGLHAAAAMGQLRSALAALVAGGADALAAVQGLDLFASDVEDARFSTAAVVDIDPESGLIHVVSAGHLPPMIRRVDGRVEQVTGGGPPLGFDPSVPRSVLAATMAPGEFLLLYTDGLVERRDEAIDVGLGRLREAMAASTATSAEGMVDDVFDSLAADEGEDDIAVLVCRLPDRVG